MDQIIVSTGDIDRPYEVLGPIYFQVSNKGLLGSSLACLGAIGAAAVVYVVLVIVLRVITYDDCMLLPGGEKIAKLLRVRA